VGGGFLALDSRVAQPQSFSTFAGLVWLAVVVTLGVRSITAAALGGLAFALLPGVFQTYIPARWGEVPAILFGLGAVMVARHPEGVVLHNGRQLRLLLLRLASRVKGREPGDELAGAERRLGGADGAVAHTTVATGGSGAKPVPR
jgi:branched-chain amino acid transport system permease protein